jgi:hypothetical protein
LAKPIQYPAASLRTGKPVVHAAFAKDASAIPALPPQL